ncbi:Uncharacterised protein [Mycobacterium tuberculosis]|nr:Uncharacterised protein [Mycobacterium tuberculosis]
MMLKLVVKFWLTMVNLVFVWLLKMMQLVNLKLKLKTMVSSLNKKV